MAEKINIDTQTISNPVSFQKLILLQKKENILDAWEDFEIKKAKGFSIGLIYIKARLKNYWMDIKPRWMRNEKLKLLINSVENDLKIGKEKEMRRVTELFLTDLDKIKFSRVDTSQEYDPNSIEEDNLTRM